MLLLPLAIAIQLSTIPLLFLSSLLDVATQVILFTIILSIYLVFRRHNSICSLILLVAFINFFITLYRINTKMILAKSYQIGRIYPITAKIIEIVLPEKAIVVELNPTHPLSLQHIFVKLNWENIPLATVLAAGQHWNFKIKISSPSQRLNFGATRINRLLISRNIWVTGKILTGHLVTQKITARQKIYNRLRIEWSSYNYSAVFAALLFGIREHQSNDRLQQFQYSGLAHLIAISGLHLQLLVNHSHQFFKALLIFLPQRYFIAYIPLILSCFLATGYSWLAGWSLPTQRAAITLIFSVFLVINGMKIGRWSLIMLTNGLILLWNPLAILSNSFWLSFLAVIGLAIFGQYSEARVIQRRVNNVLQLLFHFALLQLFLSIVMLPITILLFNGSNLLSLISNLISIPLFSYLLLPLLFVGMGVNVYFPHLSQLCWQFSEWLLVGLSQVLEPLQPFWVNLSHHSIVGSFTLLLIIIVWRIRLILLPSIFVLIIASFAAIIYVPRNYWRMDMLDVGHGLAILITQGNQSVLYDTGSSWLDYSEAKRVIMPFLNWSGFKLKKIIISHEDNDHIGGLAILKKYYPNVEVLSSSLRVGESNCIRDFEWHWQKLNFKVLWPNKASVRAYNKDSCVIVVNDGKHTVLLTGDIEKAQEKALIKQESAFLSKVDILQVPHHGSQTSSSLTFLANINPKLALFSNARQKQSNQVLKRYRYLKIPYQMTSEQGQISVLFYPENWRIISYHHYFYTKWYN